MTANKFKKGDRVIVVSSSEPKFFENGSTGVVIDSYFNSVKKVNRLNIKFIDGKFLKNDKQFGVWYVNEPELRHALQHLFEEDV